MGHNRPSDIAKLQSGSGEHCQQLFEVCCSADIDSAPANIERSYGGRQRRAENNVRKQGCAVAGSSYYVGAGRRKQSEKSRTCNARSTGIDGRPRCKWHRWQRAAHPPFPRRVERRSRSTRRRDTPATTAGRPQGLHTAPTGHTAHLPNFPRQLHSIARQYVSRLTAADKRLRRTEHDWHSWFTLERRVSNLSSVSARGDLDVPWTRLQVGKRASSDAGPAAWEQLVDPCPGTETLTMFKGRLKSQDYIVCCILLRALDIELSSEIVVYL